MRNYDEEALGTRAPLVTLFLISSRGTLGTFRELLAAINYTKEHCHDCHHTDVSLAGCDLGTDLMGQQQECPKAMPTNYTVTDKNHIQLELEKP
jgi:hypothetical protein